jgi:hypothetical protein
VLAVDFERRPDLLDHLAGLLALPRDQARALLLALPALLMQFQGTLFG